MKSLLAFLFIAFPSIAFSQLGVNFHQSNLPFIGVNYEIKNKWRPELRIGTDNYFEATTLEAVVTYDLAEREEYEIYVGLGGRINQLEGLVVPIGVNVYPLTTKQFGFHVELAPLIGSETVLRGSWGIRYRFNRGRSR